MLSIESPEVQTVLKELIQVLKMPGTARYPALLNECFADWQATEKPNVRETPDRALVRRICALCMGHRDLVRGMLREILADDIGALVAAALQGDE
jgi:hypothetical protein